MGSVFLIPEIGGGVETYRNLNLKNVPQTVKIGVGKLYGSRYFNQASSSLFVKFWDALVADVTVGVTVPKMTIGIPEALGGNVDNLEGFSSVLGIQFRIGIVVACTTGFADSDNTAPGDNEMIVNFTYY